MTDQTQRRHIAIDIVSDAVCPWCYIGKRNLEAALADLPDIEVDIRWRPYQLDATIPPEGLERRAYMQRKFGNRIDEIHQRLTQAGAAVGLDFAFDDIERSPNTLDAHRLIRWAASANAQDAIVERLFHDFFVAGKDIGDRNVLLDAARDCGMDPKIVGDLLDGDADKESVREEIASAQSIGVTGVPFFILDGKFALPGAQPAEVLKRAISKALEKADEPRA